MGCELKLFFDIIYTKNIKTYKQKHTKTYKNIMYTVDIVVTRFGSYIRLIIPSNDCYKVDNIDYFKIYNPITETVFRGIPTDPEEMTLNQLDMILSICKFLYPEDSELCYETTNLSHWDYVILVSPRLAF